MPSTTATLVKDSVFDQIKSGLEDSIEHSKKDLSSNPLNPIAQQVCEKRYFQKDKDGNIIEDWNGLVTRVVNHVCKNEDEEFKEEIFDLIYNTKFLPNSPCLVNSGNGISGLTACNVSPDVEDSWIGMCKNIETFGHVARRGGGNGVCLSKIRPSGSKVFGSTHAKACGPVSHMIVISEAMHSITQAGFRSMANMATLHINHPDVINFIHCKQRLVALKHLLREDIFNHYEQLNSLEDSKLNILLDKHISNFNISVVVSNKFMEAVENDEDFNLEFEGKVYQTIKARELFNMIAENAWRNGDPGLLFDEAVNSGPYKYSKQKITATNPCFHPDTMVAVADGRGFISIKQLADESKDVPVYCYDTSSENIHIKIGRNPRKTRENAPLIKVKFDNEVFVITTSDHRIMLSNGEYLEVQNLQIGSTVKTIKVSQDPSQISLNEQKVIEIERLNQVSDVYNITVDDYHNLCVFSPQSNIKLTSTSSYYAIIYANCGEQPIPSGSEFGAGSCCNLGSIDVSKYYDKKLNDLDWKSFKKAIHNCIQFLDNVIDANKFPTNDFAKWAKNNRPVGLGIMGFADLLLKMQIAYDSEEAFLFAEKLAKFLEDKSHEKSVQLAKDRGTPKACEYDELDHRRNVTLTSIAPTGSISLLAGCSSSIEPLFSPVIHRYDNTGSYVIPHIDKSKKYFRSAINKEEPNKEVCWQAHVKMQAAFQKYGSSGVSKTINMSNNATIEDVKQAYMFAYKTGCKGITVYRDGCKTTQVLNTSSKSQLGSNHAKPRPKEVEADIFKTRADGFDWHIIVGKVDDIPYEIFAVNGNDLPSSGKIIKRKKRHYSLVDNNENVLIDNIGAEQDHIDPKISLETRRLSLELRHNIDPKFIVEQIDKSNDVITSFSKVVSRILKTKYVTDLDESVSMPCPECAKNNEFVQMVSEASCWKCLVCSYSKCG